MTYFSHIFDVSKALEKIDFDKHGAIQLQIVNNEGLIRQLKACADKYIKRNGRSVVDLAQLFSFVSIAPR